MAYRELELTLLSARDLKNVNLITRMDVYAVVTISGDPLTRQCTAPDPSGGRNPCWNATLRFAVPPTAAAAAGRCLHVLLRAERVLGDRDIGEVIIPLADLLTGAPTSGPQPRQLASYQVSKVHRWEPRGVLNVSYRLGPVVAPVEPTEKRPVMPYPAHVPAQPFHPPADACPPPPPRPAAEHEEAPAPRNGKRNGHGVEGPTQVCVGPHTQIILNAPTGPATTTMSPTGSNVRPRKPDGGRPKQEYLQHDDTQQVGGAYHAPSQSIISPRKEDRSRPKVFSQHDTQVQAEATSQQALVPSSREPAMSPRRPPAPTFFSRSSSSSSPPYSPAYAFTLSPSSSAHPSTPSPRPLGQPKVSDAFGAGATSHTNSPRSTSTRRAAISSPLPSSPLVANHSGTVPPL